MRGHWLKYTRAILAVAVLAALSAAFVDFRGAVPWLLGHGFASMQFVPAALALATGASATLAAVVILVATLAVGRIYCSVLCPLGLLQDAVARVTGLLRRKPQLLRFTSPMTWVRQLFLWSAVAGITAGWGALTLTLIDPYSIFGRIGSMLFRPVVTVLNNWIVGPANAAGIDTLYRVPAQWAAVGAMALPAAMLLLIAILSATRGRLYCNTVCPVGTLLGFLSARGAWRLEIDRSRCRKCGDCLRVCKSQCIDLRSGSIDSSRCVVCYNCVSACDELGIRHRFRWSPGSGDSKEERRLGPAGKKPGLPPAEISDEPPRDSSRRAFITGTAAAIAAAAGAGVAATVGLTTEAVRPAKTAGAVCPPGSGGVARFLDRCTACQLCVSACPTHVLQPAFLEYGFAGVMKPRLDFHYAFCNFTCDRCAEVCPDGAILPLALAEKQVTRMGVASIAYERCVVKANGTDCAACSEHCPTQAVSTVPYGNNLRLPEVHPELCIGCGACEYACPVRPKRAITVAPQALHDRATRKVEAQAVAPTPGDNFPF